MDSLPVEMLEYILQFVDGCSLIRAKYVSKKWREVAVLYDTNQLHWKRLCFEEISHSALLEITIKKYPYWRPESKDNLNWKIIYTTWLQWRRINNFIYHAGEVLEHNSYYATCIKLVENSIIVGMHNGEIQAWKVSSGDPFHLSKHRSRVTCIDVISILDERKEAKGDKKLNYIVSTSNDRVIKITYLIEEGMQPKDCDICHHDHSTVMVRVQQSYFAILDESGAISMFLVSAPNTDGIMPVVSLIVLYHPSVPPVLTLNIWGNKVYGMTKKGGVLTADFFQGGDTMKVLFSPNNDTVHVNIVANSSSYLSKVNHYEGLEITQYYLWRTNIFLWITENHHLLISLNGYDYHEYNMDKALKTYPRTVLLYGNLLILGLDSGSVVMYYFENPEDLLHLDLKSYHWLHPVAKKPVIGMDIWESSSGPQLAVLSHTHIYLIDWSFDLEGVVYGDNMY